MPSWTLTYRIGLECTQYDLDREESLLRSDPACRDLRLEQSWLEPGLVHVHVDFVEFMNLRFETYDVILLRHGEAIPAVPFTPLVSQVLMDAEPQEGSTLQIGSQVSIDEHGRIGTRGTPIGTLIQFEGTNRARIAIHHNEPMPLQVSRLVPTADGRYQVQTEEPLRLSLDTPRQMPSMNAQLLRVQEQIRAEEDARVFAALDAASTLRVTDQIQAAYNPPGLPTLQPKPRPAVRTRYERILESFEK
jgi:hypothetical protein